MLPGEVGTMLLMLDFLNDHEPVFVKNLPLPKVVSSGSKNVVMEMYNRPLCKLQVFSNEKNNLMHFVDKTLTHAGKKKLRYLVRNPSCISGTLNERYDAVAFFINNRDVLSEIKSHLRIRDLERLYRRFAIGRIDPYGDIPNVCVMNKRIVHLLSKVCEYTSPPHWVPCKDILKKFKNYCSDIELIFNVEACKSGSDNVFHVGVSKEIEDLCNRQTSVYHCLEEVQKMLSDLIGEQIYMRNTDKDGYFYETTKKRAKKLDECLKTHNPKNLKISTTTAHAKITSDYTRKLSEEYILKQQISTCTHKLVQEKVMNWYEKYYDECLVHIIDAMAWMDVYYSYATVSIEWNYVRPELIESEDSSIDQRI